MTRDRLSALIHADLEQDCRLDQDHAHDFADLAALAMAARRPDEAAYYQALAAFYAERAGELLTRLIGAAP